MGVSLLYPHRSIFEAVGIDVKTTIDKRLLDEKSANYYCTIDVPLKPVMNRDGLYPPLRLDSIDTLLKLSQEDIYKMLEFYCPQLGIAKQYKYDFPLCELFKPLGVTDSAVAQDIKDAKQYNSENHGGRLKEVKNKEFRSPPIPIISVESARHFSDETLSELLKFYCGHDDFPYPLQRLLAALGLRMHSIRAQRKKINRKKALNGERSQMWLNLSPVPNLDGRNPPISLNSVENIRSLSEKEVSTCLKFYDERAGKLPVRRLMRCVGVRTAKVIDNKNYGARVANSEIDSKEQRLKIVFNADGRYPPVILWTVNDILQLKPEELFACILFYGDYTVGTRPHDYLFQKLGIKLKYFSKELDAAYKDLAEDGEYMASFNFPTTESLCEDYTSSSNEVSSGSTSVVILSRTDTESTEDETSDAGPEEDESEETPYSIPCVTPALTETNCTETTQTPEDTPWTNTEEETPSELSEESE